MARKKLILSTSFSKAENLLIRKLSSESGITVSGVIRALTREGISALEDVTKEELLILMSRKGRKRWEVLNLKEMLLKLGS